MINKSVGLHGVNQPKDVLWVQRAANAYFSQSGNRRRLIEDGLSGPKTIRAIQDVQRQLLKYTNPDGRVDPGGPTESALRKLFKPAPKPSSPPTSGARQSKPKQSSPQNKSHQVYFRPDVKPSLSEYTLGILKGCMQTAGLNRCEISSTIRTPYRQAKAMYENCALYPNAKDVAHLGRLRKWRYAQPGRSVESLYFQHRHQGKRECVKQMKTKILLLMDENIWVSNHCLSKQAYAQRNVFDVPFNGVDQAKRDAFEKALMNQSLEIIRDNETDKRVVPLPLTKLIIENVCWHIEIHQPTP